MPLSDYQRKQCINALDTICKMSISTIFAKPVDPKLDDCPDYYQIIKQPMDLSTVRRRLYDNVYKKVDEFKKDVALIWSNANRYNGKDSIAACLANQLERVFAREAKFITGNDFLDWSEKCEELRKESRRECPIKIIKRKELLTNVIPQTVTNDAEREKLAKDINKLDDSWKIMKVMKFIEQNEPIYVKNGEVDTDISNFNISTLNGLRALIDSFEAK